MNLDERINARGRVKKARAQRLLCQAAPAMKTALIVAKVELEACKSGVAYETVCAALRRAGVNLD